MRTADRVRNNPMACTNISVPEYVLRVYPDSKEKANPYSLAYTMHGAFSR